MVNFSFNYYPFQGIYNKKTGRYVIDLAIDEKTFIEKWGSIPYNNLHFFKLLIMNYEDREGFYNDPDFKKEFYNLRGRINPNRMIHYY